MIMSHRAIFLGLAAATLLTPASASAEPLTVTATKVVRVSYADLRLDTDEGQATLRSRSRAAAKEVCGFNEWPLEMSVVRHTCLRAVMRHADGQIERAAIEAKMMPVMAGSDPETQTIVLAVAR